MGWGGRGRQGKGGVGREGEGEQGGEGVDDISLQEKSCSWSEHS